MNLKIWDKLLDFFGFGEEQLADNDYHPQHMDDKRVISIYKKQGFRIVVHHPESFAEVKDIVNDLKMKKPIILNLENLERGVAQRIVDFISGAVYGMDGNIQKIAESVFVFAPYTVKIDGQLIKKNKTLWS